MSGGVAGGPGFVPVTWVTDLLTFYKTHGNGGTRACKISLCRRVPAFSGQSWALLERGPVQWHRDMRLIDLYPHPEVYIPQETLTDGSA